jgi:serine beta-lactamase-like protein LACTB
MKQILYFLLGLFFSYSYSQSNAIRTIDESQNVFRNEKFKSEIKRAKSLVLDTIHAKDIPGLSITVTKNDTIVWAEGFGFSDLENKVPVKINTKFRIGSVSKTLTAMAIGKLLDSKQLNLSEDVHKYVPYFPQKEHKITIAQLASHLSGIRDYDHSKNEYFNTKNYNSIKESISVFQADSLLFEPGANYNYSSYNYTLLSAVIEGVTSKNFIDYMQANVIIPLNLVNTTPDYFYSIIDNRTRFYDKYEGVLINSPAVDSSNKWAGGGYLSTSLDLVKICQSMLKNNLISKSSKNILWTPAILKNGKKTNYGIGWRIDKDKQNRTFVHHGGSAVGGRSFLLVYPDKGVIIAITSNLSDSFNQDFIVKIAEIFL